MNPKDKYLIRTTFAEVERAGEVAALTFYRHLFELDPALRPMFRGDIGVQAQKLTDMLGVLIMMLDNPAQLQTELRAMGARHKEYGVVDGHYSVVGRALLAMLAGVLGARWTPGVQTAWLALYGAVQKEMMTGAAGSEKTLTVPDVPLA
jgi:hemoglobin-like flavoprotein